MEDFGAKCVSIMAVLSLTLRSHSHSHCGVLHTSLSLAALG